MQLWLEQTAKYWERISHQAHANGMAVTDFLEEKELAYFKGKARHEGFYINEWPRTDAERKRLLIAEWETEKDLGVAVGVFGSTKTMRHPHVLGSLMALPLRREEIGDIWMLDDVALVFATESAGKVIWNNLREVGSTPVRLALWEGDWPAKPQDEGREVDVNVASLRLDTVVAEIYGLRREDAKREIERGKVKVNHVVEEKPACSVEEGDLISVQKRGRAKLLHRRGESKKGRIFVRAFVYAHKEG